MDARRPHGELQLVGGSVGGSVGGRVGAERNSATNTANVTSVGHRILRTPDPPDHVQIYLSEEALIGLFAMLDTDGSGDVDFEEAMSNK